MYHYDEYGVDMIFVCLYFFGLLSLDLLIFSLLAKLFSVLAKCRISIFVTARL